jgi:hypothetical protein
MWESVNWIRIGREFSGFIECGEFLDTCATIASQEVLSLRGVSFVR